MDTRSLIMFHFLYFDYFREKRASITPVTFESDVSSKYERKMYSDRKLYSPPQGKFSNNAGSYKSMHSNNNSYANIISIV